MKQELKTMKEAVDSLIEEFYNLHDLPEVPNFENLQERLILDGNIPDDNNYMQYVSVAKVLMLKATLEKFNELDIMASNMAFGISTSTAINNKAADVENVLDELEEDKGETDD